MTIKLGPYECLKTIGKGGMGEVLLAYDPICDRQIAIKRIRSDLQRHEVLKNRFLKEAKITSQLTHPGIISIYSIHQDKEELYYTMPYVEGLTLKQMLRDAKHEAPSSNQSKGSIPALLHIFKNLCQTVAYAHSKNVLHRDLKPENILVGKFGEVIVLDWGLAQNITEVPIELEKEITSSDPGLTSPGKLVGTVAYMPPERALGAHATVQTDLYALGVMLYQILTLHLPFRRPSIKEFCKIHSHEKLIDPEEMAPYRDVPPHLSRMVKKCLDPDPDKRYHSTDTLIHDLTSHMEGRSEWFENGKIDIKKKSDWEFQENVLISKHIAITRTTEAAGWVSIMVSKAAFSENIRLETTVQLGEKGEGIGFLLCVPEVAEREHPLDGYCLWIGSEQNPGCHLFRNTIEVMHQPEISLKQGEHHTVIIEKIDHNIHLILDGEPLFTYLSYLPLFGTHIGILSHDDDFHMNPITLYSGSQNLLVSCLAIPDAFLASKDYKRALAEYRRISYSFPGHAEGREALFRAGITLLEQARAARGEKQVDEYYTLSLEEFGKLHLTTGAPLEYLGKALVYQSLKDHTEEIKCLELGLRRYKKHPLVNAIQEQIIYRMHEASQIDRRSAYQLILIVLRLLPRIVTSGESNRLFNHLISHWEPLPFLEYSVDASSLGKEKNSELCFAIPLAFWLGAPFILHELFQELVKSQPLNISALGDIVFCLFELGSYGLAYKLMQQLEELKKEIDLNEISDLKSMLFLLEPLWICHQESIDQAIATFFSISHEDIGTRELRTVVYLIQYALRTDQEKKIHHVIEKVRAFPLSKEDQIALDSYQIWAYLKTKQWHEAALIFEKYSFELLNQEGTPLHSLYGCYLYATEGEEIAQIHFSGVIDTPFPRSWALLGHELTNKITESIPWYSTSFLWERRQLYRQMALFYHCSENTDLQSYYHYLEKQEYIFVPQ